MEKIKKILIVGAGTMGHGIAQVFAQGGYQVALQDTVPQALERAKTLVKSSLDTMVEAGLLRKNDVQTTLNRIKMTSSLEEAAEDADLAIECIIENKEAKISLFKKLDEVCPPKTLLASNSSFLNIFDFVETSRPDKMLIIHLYAPPQIIPLVDIVKGPKTNEVYIKSVIDLFKKLGKKPVLFNKPLAGYLVSRLQVAFQREIYWMLDNDYLSPKDIDEAAIWGLAMRMVVLGICQRIDFGGLDLSARTITQAPSQSTPVDYKPRKLIELVEQGALGVKAGRGFYDYQGKTEAQMCHERDVRLLKLLKFLQENDLAGPLL
jgi:3-hydroxybutyryl-CoA dehydrogenase